MPFDSFRDEARWVARAIRAYPRGLVMPFVLDLITLFILTITTGLYARKISEYLGLISTGIASGGGMPLNLSKISAEADIGGYVGTVVLLLGMMTVSAFIIYTLLQGMSWWYCIRYVEKDISLVRYMKRFALLNLIWLLPFLVVHIIQFINTLTSRLTSPNTFLFISIALVSFVGLYLATVSYCLTAWQTAGRAFGLSFVRGFRKVPLMAGYVLMIALFVVADMVVGIIGNTVLQLIIGALIIIPLVSIMRIFMLRLTETSIARGSTRRRARDHHARQ